MESGNEWDAEVLVRKQGTREADEGRPGPWGREGCEEDQRVACSSGFLRTSTFTGTTPRE